MPLSSPSHYEKPVRMAELLMRIPEGQKSYAETIRKNFLRYFFESIQCPTPPIFL